MKNGNIVILAGGISSRMKKPSEIELGIDEDLIKDANSKSKSMISVGEDHRPFLDYLLFNIEQAGYLNALIVIGEKDDSIKPYYDQNNLRFPSLNISFATQYIPADRVKPFGTADALWQGLKTVPQWQEECFTVVNSDNLYSIKAMETLLESDYENALIDYDSKGFEFPEDRVSKFAVLMKNQNGFLEDIVEKPEQDVIQKATSPEGVVGVSMNIFKLKYNMIFEILENCPINPLRNEKEIPTAVKIMIEKTPDSLYCYPFKEHVPDLTNKEDIIPVQNYLKKHFEGILQ